MLAPPPAADGLAGAPSLDHHTVRQLDRVPLPLPPCHELFGRTALSYRERIVGREPRVLDQLPLHVLQMELRLLLGIGNDPDIRLPPLDGTLEHVGQRGDRALRMPPRPNEIHPSASVLGRLRQLRFEPPMHRRALLREVGSKIMPSPIEQERKRLRPLRPASRRAIPPRQLVQPSTPSHLPPLSHDWHMGTAGCPQPVLRSQPEAADTRCPRRRQFGRTTPS
jgi:hypothetical protein